MIFVCVCVRVRVFVRCQEICSVSPDFLRVLCRVSFSVRQVCNGADQHLFISVCRSLRINYPPSGCGSRCERIQMDGEQQSGTSSQGSWKFLRVSWDDKLVWNKVEGGNWRRQRWQDVEGFFLVSWKNRV